MTHLAYVCEDDGIPIEGLKGASVHVRSMVAAFARLGVAVSILSPRITNSRWWRKLPVRPVKMDPHRIASKAGRGRKEHAWDYTFRLLDELNAVHPVDAVYERLSLWACGSSIWCRERAKNHWVEVNAPLVREAARYRGIDNSDEAARKEAEILRRASLLLPVSGWLERWLYGLGCDPERIHRLPNGVDEHWIVSGTAPNVKRTDGSIALGFVGSLRSWHDLETLLLAFERLAPECFRLAVVGDGPLRDWLKDRIARPPLKGRVEWTGALPHDDVRKAIDAMDICLAPYRNDPEFYFCPIKIYEYGARCRPVIAADVPDLVEQFPDGTLAHYEAGSAEGLALAIRALAGDDERRKSVALRLRDHVSRHTWSAHAARVVRLGGHRLTADLYEAAI